MRFIVSPYLKRDGSVKVLGVKEHHQFVQTRDRFPICHAGNARKDLKIFPKSDFDYKPEQDIYICPAGETLYPRRYDKRR